MRILHVIYIMEPGGAETMLVDIVNRQVDSNEVAVCVINDRVDDRLVNTIDSRVERIFIRRNPGDLNFIKLIFKLTKAINAFKPDVIHSHQDKIALFLPFVKSPKVLTVHHLGSALSGGEKYKSIVAISQSVKNDLFSRLNRTSVVIYNGIDTKIVRERKDYKAEKSIFRIVQVGRLDHEIKGQDIVLHALAELKVEFPEQSFLLNFIGSGPSETFLQGKVKDLNLGNEVCFLGAQSREFIYQSLAEYNLLVQPSRSEGFGLTIVEAMAARIPVLSSDNDGPEEILQSGKYGFLFKNGDVEDCFLRLKEIFLRYDSLCPQVNEAYEYAKKKFDINQTTLSYLEVYKNVIS